MGDAVNIKPILIVLMIVLVLAIGFMMKLVKDETFQCLGNPISYGLSKIGTDVTCNCIEHNGQRYFNANNSNVWWVERQLGKVII